MTNKEKEIKEARIQGNSKGNCGFEGIEGAV